LRSHQGSLRVLDALLAYGKQVEFEREHIAQVKVPLQLDIRLHSNSERSRTTRIGCDPLPTPSQVWLDWSQNLLVSEASDGVPGVCIALELAKGDRLRYMVKAILNGRVDEVIDLARTNLWREGKTCKS
jgi:hypothetical protein